MQLKHVKPYLFILAFLLVPLLFRAVGCARRRHRVCGRGRLDVGFGTVMRAYKT
jgi:hypothetical protein